MPLFEFVCTDCGRGFEELVRSSTAISEVTCPICHSAQVKKKVSTFASKVSGGGSLSFGSSNYSSASSCSTGGT